MREFRFKAGEPDADRRACTHCAFMQAAVSLWCVNDEAVKYRGTAFVGVHSCPFWEPMKRATIWDWLRPDRIVVDLP